MREPDQAKDEFGILLDALIPKLERIGALYQRGVGDICVNYDDYGSNELGVVFLKQIPEETLITVAREALEAVPSDWELWFTRAHPGVVNENSIIVVTRTAIRYETPLE